MTSATTHKQQMQRPQKYEPTFPKNHRIINSMKSIKQYKRGTEMTTIQMSSSHGTASNFTSLCVKIRLTL
jgi:hypothetical protein